MEAFVVHAIFGALSAQSLLHALLSGLKDEMFSYIRKAKYSFSQF